MVIQFGVVVGSNLYTDLRWVRNVLRPCCCTNFKTTAGVHLGVCERTSRRTRQETHQNLCARIEVFQSKSSLARPQHLKVCIAMRPHLLQIAETSEMQLATGGRHVAPLSIHQYSIIFGKCWRCNLPPERCKVYQLAANCRQKLLTEEEGLG